MTTLYERGDSSRSKGRGLWTTGPDVDNSLSNGAAAPGISGAMPLAVWGVARSMPDASQALPPDRNTAPWRPPMRALAVSAAAAPRASGGGRASGGCGAWRAVDARRYC